MKTAHPTAWNSWTPEIRGFLTRAHKPVVAAGGSDALWVLLFSMKLVTTKKKTCFLLGATSPLQTEAGQWGRGGSRGDHCAVSVVSACTKRDVRSLMPETCPKSLRNRAIYRDREREGQRYKEREIQTERNC